MGNDISSWRAAIGLYNNKGQRLNKSMRYIAYPVKVMIEILQSLLGTISEYLCLIRKCIFDIRLAFVLFYTLHFSLMVFYNTNVNGHHHNPQYTCCLTPSITNSDVFYSLIMRNLLLLAGDVKINPGPQDNYNNCFSIIHQNIRSIRSKMEYIKNNFSDFDILCFTETHLTNMVTDNFLSVEGFDKMFRKDNTAHSGGFLAYVSIHLSPKRILDLENYLPESILFQIKDRSNTF